MKLGEKVWAAIRKSDKEIMSLDLIKKQQEIFSEHFKIVQVRIVPVKGESKRGQSGKHGEG